MNCIMINRLKKHIEKLEIRKIKVENSYNSLSEYPFLPKRDRLGVELDWLTFEIYDIKQIIERE